MVILDFCSGACQMGCQFQFCGDIRELLLPLHLVQGLVLFISFYREFSFRDMLLVVTPL